jgi:CHC2-type zinc finger protein
MNVDQLVSRLDGVKRTGRGYITLCPAHADRSPSLSVCEAEDGRVLLHCFAGCSVEAICEAIGCRLADLFREKRDEGRISRLPLPRPSGLDWQQTAWRFQFHALLLWLRAESVLEAAKELDTSSWSDEEHDKAMQAINNAHRDLERADLLEGIAFGIRARGLERERHGHHTHAT